MNSETPGVVVTTIKRLDPVPGADRLIFARMADLGYVTIAALGSVAVGDKVVYFPANTCLPENLRELLASGSKVGLKERVRVAKIRGVYSEGLLAKADLLGVRAKPGTDVSELLGCWKYEEPEERVPGPANKTSTTREIAGFPFFTRFARVEKMAGAFGDDPVFVTEKLHGTSARFGWVKPAGILAKAWHFAKSLVGLADRRGVFMAGSRNVAYTSMGDTTHAFYNTNPYTAVASSYALPSLLPEGVVIYGEIVGPNIQRHYSYGHKSLAFYIYDAQVDGEWLTWPEIVALAARIGIPTVPILAGGNALRFQKTHGAGYHEGPSLLDPDTVREGVVYRRDFPRTLSKHINPAYLAKTDTTEYH